MRIQHNIPAMSSYRNYSNNVSALSKNLERLSSGYKINRAGDDAAGLAISEKMRAQISGLEQAQNNAKSGINLVQTAEGALTEVHDMLNRMVTLAEQSANGTYDDDVDRVQLQKEVDQLRSEIDRIADSANFNGINLLDGSLDSTQVSTPATTTTEQVSGQNIPILQEAATDPTKEVGTKTVLHTDGVTQAVKTSFAVDLHNVKVTGNHGDKIKVSIGGEEIEINFDKNENAISGNKAPVTTLGASALADAIVSAFNDTKGMIGGQAFTAGTAGDGSKVIFTQVNEPKNKNEVVKANMDVKIEHIKASNAEKEYTVKLTSDLKTAMQNADKLVINGTTGDFDIDSDTTATIGNYTVTYDTASSMFTIKGAGDAAPEVKIAEYAGATATLSGTTTTGSNGTTASATVTCGLTSTGTTCTLTINGNTFAFDATGNTTVNSQAFGSDNYKITFTATDGKVVVESITAGAISASVGISWADATTSATGDAAAFSGGTDPTKTKVEYTIAGQTTDYITIGTSTMKLSDINSYVDDDGQTYAWDSDAKKLTVTTGAAAGASGAVTAPAVKTNAAVAQELTLTEKPDTTGMEGTWNVKTTENVQGAPSGAGDLASTTFELTTDIVADGSILTIGEDKYTFKVGKDSKVEAGAENIIDLSDYEAGDEDLVEIAAQRLTEYCKGGQVSYGDKATGVPNKVFTVGHDANKPGVISIEEKVGTDGQGVGEQYYKKGELESVEEFDKLVYYSGIKTTTTEASGVDGKALTLQIGDTSDPFNQLTVDIKDCHTKGMGIDKIDISTQEGATKAVATIKDAINYVSDVRGTLGATQNRLDHTINNLAVMQENIQDAESTIRDVDVAKEMMEYTKNNILVQSAQAMLAQANQLPQGVLQLLG